MHFHRWVYFEEAYLNGSSHWGKIATYSGAGSYQVGQDRILIVKYFLHSAQKSKYFPASLCCPFEIPNWNVQPVKPLTLCRYISPFPHTAFIIHWNQKEDYFFFLSLKLSYWIAWKRHVNRTWAWTGALRKKSSPTSARTCGSRGQRGPSSSTSPSTMLTSTCSAWSSKAVLRNV